MSDKSFGDYSNRNIVKNPLLSSAVTGLSIEDLTHNAVLLPAVPSQETISRQDKQSGDQACGLGDTNRNLNQIVDANFNATLSDINPLDNHNIAYTNQLSNVNQTKTSGKSDDFDVNEYFARLQGTRYVSAPLNSCLTENLQSEDNLEEINLNEEKAQGIDETQHSITSDIAQNFSQLPTVLPQVASAVFSSFSSMLNLKSREQTPDESREFYNAPTTKSERLVPSIPEPQEVAPPPPKEPPVTGIPNYRITTKKKVYAQIPGLSCDSQSTHTFPPTNPQAPPTYFIPEAKQEVLSQPEYITPPLKIEEEKSEPTIIRQPGYDISFKPPEVANVDLNRSHTEDVRYDGSQIVNQTQMPPYHPPTIQQTQVIPPPPMFSNLPRKEGQSMVEKTILPPSVARRIGANQSILNQNLPPSVSMQDIFVPSVPDNTSSDNNASLNQYPLAQNVAPIQKETENVHSVPQFPPQISKESHIANLATSVSINEPQNLSAGNVLVHTFEVSSKSEETYQPSVLLDTNAPTFFNPSNMLGTDNVPKQVESNTPSENIFGQYFSQDTVTTPPKSAVEPPKMPTSVNYRLAKKKPQYYAGPIEGVGSISNNVKPILNPVEPTAFHGSLFTPNVEEQARDNTTNNPTVDQASVPFDISQTAAPMYTPFDYNDQKENMPNFNTAFDMSRPTTERFEQPNEPKGFGIIGSLKSKLSSIDINKIQNTVTTFFDPTYNDTKIEKKPMSDYSQYQSVPQYPQNEGNLEIFVPTLDQSQTPQTYTQPYNYQSSNTGNSDYYYQSQGLSNNEPNTKYGDNNLMSTYYQGWQSNQLQFNAGNNSRTMDTNYGDNLRDNANQAYAQQTDPLFKNDNITNKTEHVFPKSTTVESSCTTQVTTDATSFFESPHTIGFDKTIPPMHSFGGLEASPQNLSTVGNLNIENKSEGDFGNINNSTTIEQSFNNDVQSLQEEAVSIDESFTAGHNIPQPSCIGPITKGVNIAAPSVFDQKCNKNFFHPTDIGPPSKFCGRGKNDSIHDAVAISTEHHIKPTDIFQSMPSLGINDFTDLCIPFSIQQSFGPEDSSSSDKKEVNNEPKELNQPLLSYFKQASDKTSESLFSQHILPITSSLHTSCSQIKRIDATHKNPTTCLFNDSRDINVIGSNASNLKEEASVDFLENLVSELNICETCREVNKLEVEEKEVEDLTTQLIENITAPIQLLNPVGGPMPPVDLQFPETPIPENIIENIKPVIDLLEDDSPAPAYGWSVDNDYVPKTLIDHNYNAQSDPNAIGFFQNKSLSFENIPKNASDEIKAGFQTSQEDYSSLLRQLSLPTAPPEEEKTDEGGLDVHSIEQDAKNDFPVYGEFTIDPSETDDDKIEIKERTKSVEETVEETVEEPDSFTNRVERFKRMETSAESCENVFDVQKETKPIIIATSISPALTIASYFDTGNYAVETHYKNSLTSPATISSLNFDSFPSIRIPPGFEDEYKRRLSGTINSFLGSHIPNIPFIPDTTTQTSVSAVLTISQCRQSPKMNESQLTPVEKSNKEMPSESERLPAFSNMIKSHDETQERVPQSVTFNQGTVNIPEEKKHLEDPISFFSTEDTNEESDAYNNFSRLSSYFTTPSKPDHSKSFFELSQSQNHYRHNQTIDKSVSIKNNVESFFENHNNSNIPENYKAQMSLVQDLASTKYCSPKEDVVTTVGYFTVEYVNKCPKKSIGEPEIPLKQKEVGNHTENEFPHNNVGDKDMVGYVENIVKNCKKCCDMTTGAKSFVDINTKDIKVRKRMDEHSNDSNKNSEPKMEITGDAKKTVNVSFIDQSLHEDQNDETLMSKNRTSAEYSPVKHHWFYQADLEDKCSWRGFSMADSMALENAYYSPQLDENTLVPTDGGRFDVNVVGRLRVAVYWPEKPTNVIRCSWFYKGTTDGRYVPYTEAIADLLEEEYRHGVRTGEWHRRLMLPNNVVVVMHGPTVMVHFQQNTPEDLTNTPPTLHNRVYRNMPRMRVSEDQPRRIDHLVFMVHGAGEYSNHRKHSQSVVRTWVVRRGYDETEIEDSEPFSVDHLLLLCHGVGSACDMRFRPVEKVVDDFRLTSLQLIQSHYKSSYDSGLVGRVEVLPISWHSQLHSGETGVDRRLATVTLDSIPKLRNFTNDTILDVLFYTSPVYCQTIIDTVCSELNRIYKLFRLRNPEFRGGVSLGGHSLGSVIVYDLLCHQLHQSESGSPEKSHVTGTAGTGQPMIKYPRLDFRPDAMYALGSPIAMFECIRGVDTLGQQFRLPTCKNFFNIFHPYDPIAYRIEPMINPILRDVKPLLIPHHKGRKRMHLELKDTMARVGADIKARLMETIRSTWSHVWKTASPPTDHQLEKVVEEELEKEQLTDEPKEESNGDDKQAKPEMLGSLNEGRRVDHVLQEAPLEMINEYLFAMRSHVCYWESEDTMLLMLREIYDALGVPPDNCLPQQNMTVHRTRTIVEETSLSNCSENASTSRSAS